jgi:hypothetical protein
VEIKRIVWIDEKKIFEDVLYYIIKYQRIIGVKEYIIFIYEKIF